MSGPREDGAHHTADLARGEGVGDQLVQNAHAGIRHSDKMLLLSRISWGNSKKFRDELEAAKIAEWHPPDSDTPEAMLTHEFGHLLDTALSQQKDTAFAEPYGNDYGKVDKTWNMWVKESDTLPVSGYAVQSSRGAFGTVENRERVAEAFASIFHTPDDLKDEYVQRLESLLDEIADESKWMEATNDRSLEFKGERAEGRPALTDADRETWRETRARWMAEHFGPLWTIKNTKLYSELYDDAYNESVSALWDRRHALSAELRETKATKEKREAERQEKRRKELKTSGLNHFEIEDKLKEEGFVTPGMKVAAQQFKDLMGGGQFA